MRSRMQWRRPLATVAVALGVLSARASMMVGEFTWNDGTLEGWTESQSWVSLSNPGAGGVNNTGYLRIHMDATTTAETDPGAEWYALARVSASSLFVGNWAGKWFETEFFAEDTQPQYVQVRWQSSTNTAVWRSTVFNSNQSTMPTGTWTHLISPTLTSYQMWDFGGGSQQLFVNDLATIDWIGVYIWRTGQAEQDYGLDDFRLMVPEPHEYAMLAAAALGAFVVLRNRRRRGALAPVPAGPVRP
jgi:MYXO-CTERM domain-containing protein